MILKEIERVNGITNCTFDSGRGLIVVLNPWAINDSALTVVFVPGHYKNIIIETLSDENADKSMI